MWLRTQTGVKTYMNAAALRVRPLSDLAFYCHPVYLFLAVWAVMLGSLEIQVSESTYPDRSMGVILFLVSVLALSVGVGAVRLANYARAESPVSLAYRIDSGRLREINWLLCFCIIPIVAYNYLTLGPPPVLGFFGVSTVVYLEYGRLRQVLFPMAMALFVNSALEESRVRRWFWRCSSLGILLAYVARGPILMAVSQAIVLYSIRTSASKRKVYVRATIALLLALVAMDVIGNNRTAETVFFEGGQIKKEFRTWPLPILWPVTYFSLPISNMCWIVKRAHFTGPSLSFLYQILPAFLLPTSPHEAAVSDSHIIDGTHTYLANYFLDFSWAGIVACNFAIGLAAGFLTRRERISRKFMSSPIVLSAIGFIFFWDFFTTLSTVLEFCIQAWIQRSCIAPIRTPAGDSNLRPDVPREGFGIH
jgi:oligosaccharide repeat unit polymerase